jgi:spore germination cell wall hydrolase CwlJ-like protein
MFSKFGRRGMAAVATSCLVLVGGASQAWGQTVPALKPIDAVITNIGERISTPVVTPVPAKPSLDQLVVERASGPDLDAEAKCVATAVYFESMGEPLEGQLAVARVVLNRAASGRYPTSWCGVVKQKAQFSFVRSGRFPRINTTSDAWAKAKAITRIAVDNAVDVLPTDVLWYHADYVAPRWRRNLQKVEKIGAHIFYRA